MSHSVKRRKWCLASFSHSPTMFFKVVKNMDCVVKSSLSIFHEGFSRQLLFKLELLIKVMNTTPAQLLARKLLLVTEYQPGVTSANIIKGQLVTGKSFNCNQIIICTYLCDRKNFCGQKNMKVP